MFDRPTTVDDERVRVALDCLAAGVVAADPATAVANHLTRSGAELRIDDDRYDLAAFEDVVVIGGGNAAGVLAAAIEDVLGDWIDRGAVVTDNPVETNTVAVRHGDHPLPSERGAESTAEVLTLAEQAGADDLVVVAITGGGSALLAAPVADISLADLQRTTEGLLASGADIGEINAVRKHCSAIKGGRLARAAAPATVIGLVISDVVGNHLDVVASGPLAPDGSTYADALDVLDRYDVDVPDSITTWLRAGAAGERPETPARGDPAFENVHQYVLADGMTALRGAATEADTAGFDSLVLSSRLRGEAREVGTVLAGIAEEAAATGQPIDPPAVVLSGGETTVTVRGDGSGGPNQECALSAAIELQSDDVVVASIDTDGIDGASDAAGAVASAATVDADGEARTALENNDAGGYFEHRDCLVVSGPTNTNVNDLRALVIDEG